MRSLNITKKNIDEILNAFLAFQVVHDAMFPEKTEPSDLFDTLEDDMKRGEVLFSTPEYKLVHHLLAELTLSSMQDLQGLMYLGRGDYCVNDFWVQRDMLDMSKDKEQEIAHVLSKAPLFEYLAEGFEIANTGRIA